MTKILKKAIYSVLAVAFWLAVWQILHLAINDSFLLPSIAETFSALIKIVTTGVFFESLVATFIRVLVGLIIGIGLGIIIGYLSFRINFVAEIVSPLLSAIKATPIASIIILLWLLLNGNSLAIFITVLMILPMISETVISAFKSIDKDLLEVCDIYQIRGFKRAKLLVFPHVVRFLMPTIITSVGMAWKAEVAAEVIGYVSGSIGAAINDAKSNFDTDTVFAWTLIVILFSVLLEQITRYLLRRVTK